MGDEGELWCDVRYAKRQRRSALGVNCPRCKEVRPKAHPSILLPGQRCKVDGYVDPRKGIVRVTLFDSTTQLSTTADVMAQGNVVTLDPEIFPPPNSEAGEGGA